MFGETPAASEETRAACVGPPPYLLCDFPLLLELLLLLDEWLELELELPVCVVADDPPYDLDATVLPLDPAVRTTARVFAATNGRYGDGAIPPMTPGPMPAGPAPMPPRNGSRIIWSYSAIDGGSVSSVDAWLDVEEPVEVDAVAVEAVEVGDDRGPVDAELDEESVVCVVVAGALACPVFAFDATPSEATSGCAST